jgi:hypothetical protein
MDWLSGLLRLPASIDDLRAAAMRGGSSPLRAANAHIHLPPNFSAFESLDQAVKLAATQGVRILGGSNYYDYSVYRSFAEKCLRHDIYPLFGLEIIAMLEGARQAGVLINDPGNPGKMYLCGKGITRFSEPSVEGRRLLNIIRRNDQGRMRTMAALLARVFQAAGLDTGLEDEAVIDAIVRRHSVPRDVVTLQERHLAQAFQEALFRTLPPGARAGVMEAAFGRPAKSGPADHVQAQNEIRTHLMKAGRPAFVEESFVNLELACRLILELGGIPCYPTLADGASPICGYEDPPEKLIRTLEEHGIYCAEFIPLRNDPAVLQRYVEAMRAAGFVITGGTEHNTLDLVGMEPTCRHRAPVPEEVRRLFLEGAHVVVAHQYLSLMGETGYVDGRGSLNPAFRNREERIDHFRRLGEVVVAQTLAGARH